MSGNTEAQGQEPRAKIGIISMGDMGSALASLLIANGYAVATNCTGRSQDTIDRAITVGAELLSTDEALITQCDVILSIVPPAQAAATAERIITAFKRVSSGPNPRCTPLYFADMNAISPSTVKSIAAQFTTAGLDPDRDVRFVDGCILGVTPSRKQQTSSTTALGPSSTGPAAPIPAASTSTKPVASFPQEDILHDPTTGWSYPLLPTSGPWSFTDETTFPYPYGNHFASTLHIEHMLSDPDPNSSSGAEKQQTTSSSSSSSEIGQASALKNVYASLAKGFAALSLLSLSTAHSLRILPSFLSSLERLAPSRLNTMTRYVTTLPPKAYRWVREMEEISKTFTDEEVGWDEDKEDVFKHVAGVFRFVADETVLGQEKVGKRRRGLDLEDLCQAMGEGLEGRRKRRAVEKEGEACEK
ncbi:hypothetical protein NEUTE1DRAFT_125832 [Neurospora tetrasperma FGSC 2508]|uniref:6-phosphogluconate dehydrogenase C-terminal domain-like protein n=1 Tax=Neurospora tetrasperma (strain FGSC 2508 / ATCC MYA-4615 / P0657) TaxID=510951 RepID=F8N1J2_NEUT8|nr:uncharacterized protein NEUTE1DRAFT_125832 [Neurospora tetrasperma FGSC 2508]EGO52323.1 hypothetical protein NEUTE1DRAFT_125832 [Neurospora tetrasperma FGSC 2508]